MGCKMYFLWLLCCFLNYVVFIVFHHTIKLKQYSPDSTRCPSPVTGELAIETVLSFCCCSKLRKLRRLQDINYSRDGWSEKFPGGLEMIMIFIGPRYTWGPIYGSRVSVTN